MTDMLKAAKAVIDKFQEIREKLEKSSRYGLLYVVPAVLVLSAVTVFYWWSQVDAEARLRQETLANAELRGKQVNDAVSETVSMLFFNADAALQNLIDFYKQDKGPSFSQKAKVLIERFPAGSVMQVAVIGRDGFLEYSNISGWERIYLGDREHFRIHWKNPEGKLYISKPLMGRVSKQWSIQFSRPILNRGEIEAVMVLSVSPAYLYESLRKLAQGVDDTISVFAASGEFMARSSVFEKSMGVTLRHTTPYVGAAPGQSGFYTKVSEIDQVRRLYHWNRLQSYPVAVVLGLNVEKLMLPVEEAISRGRVKALFGTLALWLATLMAVYLSTRMQAFAIKRRELEYAANHDLLTGIGNRKALVNHLGRLVDAPTGAARTFALLFIDLDGFKAINDLHGHMAGDEVLKAVASRIKGCARGHDLVARLGGDEFVVVYHADDDGGLDVTPFVARVMAALEMPMAIDHKLLTVGASIGVARYPEDGATPDALLAASDRSMYHVKVSRRA